MTVLAAPGARLRQIDASLGEIRLSGLTKRYGDALAVDDLSVDVGASEFVALLGPSGCGKSTTLRMLAGLEQPDRGRVWLSGQDVTGVPAHRRDIHTVFQSYALFPHLNVADNVAFPLRQRGVGRAEIGRRVAEALALVHLPHAAGQSVTSMSGGQQQRVALARAVVDRPSVLLLDEPLSALDRSLRQAMQVELRLLQQELGVTTVLVTHDQEEALSLADRLVIMNNGRPEQIGTAEDVYDRPASLFVARFVGEQNEIAGHCDGTGSLVHKSATVVASTQMAAGDGVALVRPEHIRVDAIDHTRADPAPREPNAVDGVVRGVSIAGISTVVLVHCAALTVLARVPRDGRPLPAVGQPRPLFVGSPPRQPLPRQPRRIMTSHRRLTAALASLLTAVLATTGLASCGSRAPVADPSTYPATIEPGSTLRIYSWADYMAPANIEAFEQQTGVDVQVDAYASADEAVAKLRLTEGTSGYDLVVMDGSYVQQLAQGGGLLAWDRKRLTGFDGLSTTFVGKAWDPENTYAIPKSGGSTGWIWDSAVVTKAPTTWTEFYETFDDPAVKGRTSVLDGAASFVGSYFWANGISDQTTDPADYEAAEKFFDGTVLSHLKEFNSYPRAEVASGDVVLAQTYTGDARSALMTGPETLRFTLGYPQTDLYVDHWVLPTGSNNIAAAHAFVDLLLQPDRAAIETQFHGYYTGVEASRERSSPELPFSEVVYFDQGVPADQFQPAELTESRRLAVASFQRLKALASR